MKHFLELASKILMGLNTHRIIYFLHFFRLETHFGTASLRHASRLLTVPLKLVDIGLKQLWLIRINDPLTLNRVFFFLDRSHVLWNTHFVRY